VVVTTRARDPLRRERYVAEGQDLSREEIDAEDDEVESLDARPESGGGHAGPNGEVGFQLEEPFSCGLGRSHDDTDRLALGEGGRGPRGD
jgi:hypothetical protein